MGEKGESERPPGNVPWPWDSLTPTEGDSVCPCTQRHLLKLLLSLVEPSMACPVLLLGHLHDLLEGGIVLAGVLAQEDIQAGQGLLLLLLSSLSCSGVQVG